MKLTIEKNDRYTNLIIKEKNFTAINATSLKSEFAMQMAEGNFSILINLGEVEFIDSSGLGAILNGHRMVNEHNGFLILYGLNQQVMSLIKIAKLDKFLSITGTQKEAIDLLIMEEIERDLTGEIETQ